eukprot:5237681-Prymnesium_polylepis.1
MAKTTYQTVSWQGLNAVARKISSTSSTPEPETTASPPGTAASPRRTSARPRRISKLNSSDIAAFIISEPVRRAWLSRSALFSVLKWWSLSVATVTSHPCEAGVT